jgi:hypothetical protein
VVVGDGAVGDGHGHGIVDAAAALACCIGLSVRS